MIYLGKLRDDKERKRDAVHVAVAPATAGERLSPGEPVAISGGIAVRSKSPIGIVDPFLTGPVFEKERFWVLIHPGSITNLRHEWDHPELSAEDQTDSSAAMAWIKVFAKDVGVDYAALIQWAKDFLDSGTVHREGCRFEGNFCGDEFWDHFEKLTGRIVPSEQRDNFLWCYDGGIGHEVIQK